MAELDKNMPNRIRVEHILGIDDKNQQGNLAASQGAALQAWNDLQALLTDAVSGQGQKVGGQSYVDALKTLMGRWSGPAADEFKKQADKICSFGGSLTKKIDGQAGSQGGDGWVVDSSSSTWKYSVDQIQTRTSGAIGNYHTIVSDFSDFAVAVGDTVNGMLGREMTNGQKDHSDVINWKNGYSYAVTWKTKRWVWLCPDTITAVTVETWRNGSDYAGSVIDYDHRIHDYDTDYADHVLTHHGPTFDGEFRDLHSNLSSFYNETATQFPMGLDPSGLPAPDLSGHPGQIPTGPGNAGGPGGTPGGGIGNPKLPHGGTSTNPGLLTANNQGTTIPGGTHQIPPAGTHQNPPGGTHQNPPGGGTYENPPDATHHNPLPTNPPGGNGSGTYHLPTGTPPPTTSLPGPGGSGIAPFQTTTAGYTPANPTPFSTGGGPVGDPALGGFHGGGSFGNPAGATGGGVFNPSGGFSGGFGGGTSRSGDVSNPAFAGGEASAEAAAARQAALAEQAAAGEAGMAGRMPMMPPMAPMGGAGGDKSDRSRRSWIPEDADLWGTDDVTSTPPVIGA